MDFLAALEHEGHLLSVAARHDPTAQVPSCPGWTVDDLLRHVGGAHHMAFLVVSEGRQERPAPEEMAAPHGNALAWYEAGLAALLDTFRTTDPATPVWAFNRIATAQFWPRRMAHETTVHRVDAQLATGGLAPIAPELAVDGIGEMLEVFVPRLAKHRPDPTPGTVHLHATDIQGEWLITFGDTLTVTQGHAKGDAAVRGSAQDLYLWLWGRVPTADLEVFGDAEMAERLRRLTSI